MVCFPASGGWYSGTESGDPIETAALGIYQAQGPSFPEIKDHLGTLTTLKEPEIGNPYRFTQRKRISLRWKRVGKRIPEIMTLSHELLIDMAIEPIFPPTAKPSFQISTLWDPLHD